MSNLETTGKEDMGLLVEDSILDLEKVVEAIKWELKNALNWTTLECDWGTVCIEIPYRLSFSSAQKPWGYRYMVHTTSGETKFCNPLVRNDMDLILIDLIDRFCRTKWGNLVDGKSTLYEFIPKSKRAMKH